MSLKKQTRSTKIVIQDHEWSFHLVTKRAFKKHADPESGDLAITVPTERAVYFLKDEFTLGLVFHELVHVYVEGLCIGSTQGLTVSDFEEQIAELMQKYHEHFFQNAHRIYGDLGGTKR